MSAFVPAETTRHAHRERQSLKASLSERTLQPATQVRSPSPRAPATNHQEVLQQAIPRDEDVDRDDVPSRRREQRQGLALSRPQQEVVDTDQQQEQDGPLLLSRKVLPSQAYGPHRWSPAVGAAYEPVNAVSHEQSTAVRLCATVPLAAPPNATKPSRRGQKARAADPNRSPW